MLLANEGSRDRRGVFDLSGLAIGTSSGGMCSPSSSIGLWPLTATGNWLIVLVRGTDSLPFGAGSNTHDVDFSSVRAAKDLLGLADSSRFEPVAGELSACEFVARLEPELLSRMLLDRRRLNSVNEAKLESELSLRIDGRSDDFLSSCFILSDGSCAIFAPYDRRE